MPEYLVTFVVEILVQEAKSLAGADRISAKFLAAAWHGACFNGERS
jgi:hypothetical protein